MSRFLPLLLLALSRAPVQETRTEGAATVSPMGGDLRIWRGAKKKIETVAKQVLMDSTDRVGSPKGDPVVLMSDDDIVLSVKGVKIGDGVGLSLVRTEAGLVVRFADGSLLVDAFEKPLTIETAGGRISGKQAYFLIELKDGVTKVTAIDGELTFSNPAGEVKLDGGQESTAKEGEAPAEPKNVTIADPSREFTPKGSMVNVVKNPGYEEDLSVGWSRIKPKETLRAIDAKVVHSGKNAMRITVTPETTKYVKAPFVTELDSDQFLTWTPGRRYLVRVYVRRELRKGAIEASLWVAGVKSVDDRLKNDDMIFENVKCGDGWKMHRTIVTATKKEGYVGMKSRVDETPYDATIWIDDWSAVELPDVGKK